MSNVPLHVPVTALLPEDTEQLLTVAPELQDPAEVHNNPEANGKLRLALLDALNDASDVDDIARLVKGVFDAHYGIPKDPQPTDAGYAEWLKTKQEILHFIGTGIENI